MIGILITILFLMIILLIFTVLLLYLRQNRLLGLEKKLEATLAESESMILAFLMEIREENEQFISDVKKLQESSDTTVGHGKETTEKHQSISSFNKNNMDSQSTTPIFSDAYSQLLTTKSYSNSNKQHLSKEPKSIETDNNGDDENEQSDKVIWSELPYPEQVFYLNDRGYEVGKSPKHLIKEKRKLNFCLNSTKNYNFRLNTPLIYGILIDGVNKHVS